MKKVKIVSALMGIVILLSSISIPGSAVSANDNNNDGYSLAIFSSSAGNNGSYCHDAVSNTTTYIPANATLSETGIEETTEAVPDSVSEDYIDPEIDKIVRDLLSSETRVLPDYRVPVTSVSGYERSTCLVGARYDDEGCTHVDGTTCDGNGVHSGTGWLINNNYLITAGHVVRSLEHLNNGNNGWAQHVAIYVGATNGNYIHYTLGTTYYAGGDYVACDTELEYRQLGMYDDWAIVKLDVPVTASVSKLSIQATNSAAEMVNKTYTTQGYPADLNSGKPIWNQYTMYKQTNGEIERDIPLPRALDLVSSVNINFCPGQSGAALYSNGVAQAIGIGKYEDLTTFVLINDWLYDYIYDNFL